MSPRLGFTGDVMLGRNVDRRRRGRPAPETVTVGSLRVGVSAFTDNTPEYAAGPERPGVARLDTDLSAGERATVRSVLAELPESGADLLVASLHWGPNMVAVPDERYRDFGRWLLDESVDVVHGHSAHVFQGVERYRDGWSWTTLVTSSTTTPSTRTCVTTAASCSRWRYRRLAS